MVYYDYIASKQRNIQYTKGSVMTEVVMPKKEEKAQPLPVYGYTSQSEKNTRIVNQHRILEEHLLRLMDEYVKMKDDVDQRWLAIARTDIEKGFMALNRSIFKPQRFDVSKVSNG